VVLGQSGGVGIGHADHVTVEVAGRAPVSWPHRVGMIPGQAECFQRRAVADLDHASQRLLIEAADELPPTHQRPPAARLSTAAGGATLLNHALASRDPKAVRLLRQPDQAEREDPESEP
jgi:hypothetical protein